MDFAYIDGSGFNTVIASIICCAGTDHAKNLRVTVLTRLRKHVIL